MKRTVYDMPVISEMGLVERISTDAAMICETPGNFGNVSQSTFRYHECIHASRQILSTFSYSYNTNIVLFCCVIKCVRLLSALWTYFVSLYHVTGDNSGLLLCVIMEPAIFSTSTLSLYTKFRDTLYVTFIME